MTAAKPDIVTSGVAGIPGPRGAQALRAWVSLLRRPLATMVQLVQQYGDAVTTPISPRARFFLLTRPEHAEHVLATHQDNYVKAWTYQALRAMLGSGLLTSEGEQWRRHRRLVQPVFARRYVRSFAPLMVGAASRTLDRWNALSSSSGVEAPMVDAAAEMNRLTLDVVGRALFGIDLRDDAQRVAHAVTVLQAASVNPAFLLLLWQPRLAEALVTKIPRYGRAVADLEAVVTRIVAERRAAPAPDEPRDLLDLLLAARDEDGSGLGDREVRDEVITFVLAGHETTANALAWSLSLLSGHPDARGRLEDEVDAVLGGRDPDVDSVDKLPWTAAVISEAMRLYPPAWTIERDEVHDDEIEGIPVPAGNTVAVPPYLVHRNPDHWPKPERFDPERFLPESAAGRHRYAFIPFGGGRRGCVGAGFATLEGTLVLAKLVQHYRLDLIPAYRPVPEAHVTLRPRGGLPMTLRRRR
ncbi:MAG: cytochrome P450 [Streptosporangiales bacterium]|nr:cytochrome P450 [Streptosporangiales bacterium]